MVTTTLQPQLGLAIERLNEPDCQVLQEATRRMAPGAIVHLAGVDPSVLQLLNPQSMEPENTDGFVLRKAERGYDAVTPAVQRQLAVPDRSSREAAQRQAAATASGGRARSRQRKLPLPLRARAKTVIDLGRRIRQGRTIAVASETMPAIWQSWFDKRLP
jgi:hypothetical protein